MEITRKRIAAHPLSRVAAVLAALGVACGQQPKAPSQADPWQITLPTRVATQSQAAPPSKETKQASIVDPVMQMEAYSLHIPADWILDATVAPGPSCNPLPNAIYRTMSADGITQMKALPAVSWTWGRLQSPYAPAQKNGDCLTWEREVPAAEFLTYMIGVLKVDLVRNESIPAADLAKFQDAIRKNNESFAARTPPGQPAMTAKGERARAVVRYQVNSIPVEEVLDVWVSCMDMPQALIPRGFGHVHTCNGLSMRSRARQGKLEAMRPVFDAIAKSLVVNQQWMQKWTAMVQSIGAAVRAKGVEDENRLLRMNAQMTQAHQVQIAQQQAMTAQTVEGAQRAIARDREATSEQSRMSHDWADIALDLQKRQDPNTGEISKDSSAYSYTWVSDLGGRKQTNDGSYNPNGLLPGNWTLQTNIR